MANEGRDRAASLQSALERLSLAVFTVEGGRTLTPLNRRADEIFAAESLTDDILGTRPAHPLSILINSLLSPAAQQASPSHVVEFPGGRRYRVEASRPSEKGPQRTLMLLLAPADDRQVDELFDEWSLTTREREIAHALMNGETTEEICEHKAIAPNTLKTHLRSLLTKSYSVSRAQFLAKLLRRP